jgi:hypothetical protein
MSTTSDISLFEYQKPHVKKIHQVLRTHIACLDTSATGSGKTITSLYLAKHLFSNLIVICPPSISSNWIEKSKQYGISLSQILSYDKLRGTQTRGCSNELLSRIHDTYYPTKLLQSFISNSTLFVFDESHNAKSGKSCTLSAVFAIISSLSRSKSRALFLSATPADKPEFIPSICRMLGILKQEKLYEYNYLTQMYVPTGICEIIDFAKKFNKDKASEIPLSILHRSNASHLVHSAFLLFRDFVTSGMSPVQLLVNIDLKNGYYNMDKEDISHMLEGRKILRSGIYDEEKGKKDWGKITRGLNEIESSKKNLLIRLANSILSTDPKAKVILYMWYRDNMKDVFSRMKTWNPRLMNGETKQKERSLIISEFQAANTNVRLLITSPRVGGIGISLDDIYGNFPRYSFVIPHYRFIDIHQSAGRTHRATTKSESILRIVYSKQFEDESFLLQSLVSKSETTRSTLSSGQKVQFLDDYGKYIENE